MEIQFEPLQSWPYGGTGIGKKRAPFRASYPKTLELLKDELTRLNARSVALQSGHSPHDIRNDGWIRVNARVPIFPAVCLNFLKWRPNGQRNPQGEALGVYERLEFPCATFDLWEDNLRAIALTLESLRRSKMYGVGSEMKDQHYAGFATHRVESRSASAGPNDKFTPEAAANVLSACAGPGFSKEQILNSREMMESAYKAAARKSHPDVGGTHNQFAAVSNAATVLRAHHS